MEKQIAKWERVAEWGTGREIRSAMMKAESAWEDTGDVRVKDARDSLRQAWGMWARWV